MAEEPTRRIELPQEPQEEERPREEPPQEQPTYPEQEEPPPEEPDYLEQATPEHAESQPVYDQPVAYVSLGLTVGDGFKFGCGLMMAVVITLLAGLLLISVALLLASLMGVPVPVGSPRLS